MDDIDVTSNMSTSAASELSADPFMLTVDEAAAFLNIGRAASYELVHLFEDSGGAEGIPAVRIRRVWRVPRADLLEWIRRGCTGGSPGVVPDELAPRQRPSAEGASGPGAAGRRLTIRRGGLAAGARSTVSRRPNSFLCSRRAEVPRVVGRRFRPIGFGRQVPAIGFGSKSGSGSGRCCA